MPGQVGRLGGIRGALWSPTGTPGSVACTRGPLFSRKELIDRIILDQNLIKNHKGALSHVFYFATFSGMDLAEPYNDTVVATTEHYDEAQSSLYLTKS